VNEIRPENINSNVWYRLTKTFQQNRATGAYLFIGPKGLGKLEIAFEFMFLDEELNQRRELVWKGGHSDVIILKPQIEEKGDRIREKQISLEETQEALKKFGYCLAEAQKKFLIIQSAEQLTDKASNSLLKTIEELSENYFVILITSDENRILKTIQSRCQRVHFNLKSDQEIEKFVKEKAGNLKLEKDLLKDLVFLSRGRIKEAKKYLENSEHRKKSLKKLDIFKQALKGDLNQGFKIANEETKNKEEFLENLDDWLYYLSNFLKDNILTDQDLKIQKKVFEIVKILNENKKILTENQNVNLRLLMENFFVRIK
jgi:DNA polymerase III delta prime subunit